MGIESGELKFFNPSKDVSREITLEILIRHRDSMKQARTGEIVGIQMDDITDNKRAYNKVRALALVISCQKEMITISRAILKFRSLQKWRKKYREDINQIENPFDKDDNDYNKAKEWLEFLRMCEDEIRKAEMSRTKEDDFIVSKLIDGEEKFNVTKNFHEMIEDLEDSYEDIHLLMLTNKIVSAGIEEDEEMTYKEKEAEAIRRVQEA